MIDTYEIRMLRKHPELRECAAARFHVKFQIPEQAYRDMTESIRNASPVPQWCLEKNQPESKRRPTWQ